MKTISVNNSEFKYRKNEIHNQYKELSIFQNIRNKIFKGFKSCTINEALQNKLEFTNEYLNEKSYDDKCKILHNFDYNCSVCMTSVIAENQNEINNIMKYI